MTARHAEPAEVKDTLRMRLWDTFWLWRGGEQLRTAWRLCFAPPPPGKPARRNWGRSRLPSAAARTAELAAIGAGQSPPAPSHVVLLAPKPAQGDAETALLADAGIKPDGIVPFRGELTADQLDEFRRAVRTALRDEHDEHGHWPPGPLAGPVVGDIVMDGCLLPAYEPTLPPLPPEVLPGLLHACPDVTATCDPDVTDCAMRAIPASVLTREHIARVMHYTAPGSLKDFVQQVLDRDDVPLVDAQLALTAARTDRMREVARG